MERKDELTILGKTTAYKQDYAPSKIMPPKCWRRLSTSIPKTTIGYGLIVRSLPVYAPLQGSPTLRKYASAICPT